MTYASPSLSTRFLVIAAAALLAGCGASPTEPDQARGPAPDDSETAASAQRVGASSPHAAIDELFAAAAAGDCPRVRELWPGGVTDCADLADTGPAPRVVDVAENGAAAQVTFENADYPAVLLNTDSGWLMVGPREDSGQLPNLGATAGESPVAAVREYLTAIRSGNCDQIRQLSPTETVDDGCGEGEWDEVLEDIARTDDGAAPHLAEVTMTLLDGGSSSTAQVDLVRSVEDRWVIARLRY